VSGANADALAIRWALECSDGPLRRRALAVVAGALRRAGGNATHAADALGVDVRTLRRWRADYREIDRRATVT